MINSCNFCKLFAKTGIPFAIVIIGAINVLQFLNRLILGSGFVNSSLAISTTSIISSASSFFTPDKLSFIAFIIHHIFHLTSGQNLLFLYTPYQLSGITIATKYIIYQHHFNCCMQISIKQVSYAHLFYKYILCFSLAFYFRNNLHFFKF